MPRMRSVKPEYWHDQEITRLDRDVRLMYIGLWNLADEHARLQGDPRFIKGQLFPYDDDLTAKKIDAMIDALVTAGKAERYQVRGAEYLYLPKLSRHQRLEPDKVASRLPGPEESERRADTLSQDSDLSANENALSMLSLAGGMEHVPRGPEPRTDSARDIQRAFDEFWSAYPRKIAKPEALKRYQAARKSGTPADVILSGARKYAQQTRGTDEQYIAHPSTWLNQGRWSDEPGNRPPVAANGGGEGRW